MVAEHTIEESTPDRSNVNLRFSFTGLLGTLVGRLFRSVTQRYLAQETAALKLEVEGNQRGSIARSE
jgi:hypothetical protein